MSETIGLCTCSGEWCSNCYERALQMSEPIRLTAEQWEAMQRMIDDPSPPPQALVDLFKETP